jgi:hypothetical protein
MLLLLENLLGVLLHVLMPPGQVRIGRLSPHIVVSSNGLAMVAMVDGRCAFWGVVATRTLTEVEVINVAFTLVAVGKGSEGSLLHLALSLLGGKL